jgi:DNA ligase 1
VAAPFFAERIMPDLEDGESIEVQGSGSARYLLRNVGEVYSCTCPAWRNQSLGIEKRTCKHLKALRGDAAELTRVGAHAAPAAKPAAGAAASAAGATGAAVTEGPPILLANPWDNDQDLTGWWMSEKLDGVRAYWDGKAFISRLGNRYHAPDWFTVGLPDTPLDGELWGGRKKFQRTISVVRRQDKSDHWKEISFVVFDVPSHAGPFEERMDLVRSHLDRNKPAHAKYLDQHPCKGVDHLREELKRVESLGGEGLMLRRPGSRYEVGRSSSLLKVKSFFDAEALVIEHLPGTGRHLGRLGALLVELPDGVRFSVGTGFSDKERKSPPPLKSIITFRYQELSEAGVPRFPSYVCVRDDVRWPPDNALVRKAGVSPPTDTIASAGAIDTAEEPPLAAAPRPAPAAIAVASGGAKQRFELSEGGAAKFWEIEVSGKQHTVRYGRIGTSGQAKTKDFADAAAAERDAKKLVAEKTAKGYRPA